MLFRTNKYEYQVDLFVVFLSLSMAGVSLAWVYFYLNYETFSPTQTVFSPPLRITLSPELTVKPAKKAAQVAESVPLQKPAEPIITAPEPTITATELEEMPKAKPSLEELLNINPQTRALKKKEEREPERVFSSRMQQQIDAAKQLRARLPQSQLTQAAEDMSRTNAHGDLYVESENGCLFRKINVAGQDYWYGVRCERKDTISLDGYESPYKVYAEFQ